jgi:hypothetical protein
MSTTKSYEEIVDFIASGTTPEAVIAFRPSDVARKRVEQLVERSKDGTLLSEEQSELEDYLQLEHIMIMAKARARQYTLEKSYRRIAAPVRRRTRRPPQ